MLNPVIILSISLGIKAPVRNKRNNICIWLTIDHNIPDEDVDEDDFAQFKIKSSNAINPTTDWLVILNIFAISDCGKLQFPELKLYPE